MAKQKKQAKQKQQNKVDWDSYKFHPSSVGYLMTQPRRVGETMSAMAKDYLDKIWIQEVYGRVKDIQTWAMEKGTWAEEDSLDLVTAVDKKIYIKNKKQYENDYLIGTPDVITEDAIIDIKSSWDIFTFHKADGTNKLYYWQLQGYMWMLNKKQAFLYYVLVDTPEHIRVQMTMRMAFKLGYMDGSEEMAELENQIEKNMTYGDIPQELRVKKFRFEFDEEAIKKLKTKIILAREYLANITL